MKYGYFLFFELDTWNIELFFVSLPLKVAKMLLLGNESQLSLPSLNRIFVGKEIRTT